MNKTILVTGGGGYIGTVLVYHLLRNRYTVTVLDNFTKGNVLPKHKNLKIFNGNVLNKKIIKQSVKNNNFLIHLAGISDGRAGKLNPELTKKTNLDAFNFIIDIAANTGIKRFLNMSTFGVYGNNYKYELTENLNVNPQEPYSETKAQTEIITNKYNSQDFLTLNIRLAMVFGLSPQMRFDFLINTLIKTALEKQKLIITGGEQRRPQIHIKDAVFYLTKIINADKEKIAGQTFNLGTINPSVKEIAETIKKKNPDLEINYLPPKKNENSFILNSDKIFKILNKKTIKNIDFAYDEIKNRYYEVD